MNPASEVPRLGPIEILERVCGDYFASGKRIVEKLIARANCRFKPCVVDTNVALSHYLSLSCDVMCFLP